MTHGSSRTIPPMFLSFAEAEHPVRWWFSASGRRPRAPRRRNCPGTSIKPEGETTIFTDSSRQMGKNLETSGAKSSSFLQKNKHMVRYIHVEPFYSVKIASVHMPNMLPESRKSVENLRHTQVSDCFFTYLSISSQRKNFLNMDNIFVTPLCLADA